METQVRSALTPLPAVSLSAAETDRRQQQHRACLRQEPQQWKMAPAMDHQHEEEASSGEVAQAVFLSRWRLRQAAWGARQERRHSIGEVEEQGHLLKVEREG